MDDWKNNLTKTPYLVLFVVLISISVSTVSAGVSLPTITLAGQTHTEGTATFDEFVDISAPLRAEKLRLGANDSIDDAIMFSGDTESFKWNEATNNFELSNGLSSLLVNGVLSVGTNDSPGDDIITFHDDSNSLKWDDSIQKFTFNRNLNIDNEIFSLDSIFFDNNESIEFNKQNGSFLISNATNIAGPIHTGVNFFSGSYNIMGGGLSDKDLDDSNDLFIKEDLEVDGLIFSDGGCIGCMTFYTLTKPTDQLVAGTNTFSCNSGDMIISGGGWVPGTTAWLRESWATDLTTWKIHFTDVNGNGVKPGAFKITCADLDPN